MARKRIKREPMDTTDTADATPADTTTPSKGRSKKKAPPKKTSTAVSTAEKTPKFKCSQCLSGFAAEEDINEHIFRQHYGLARINDDTKTPFTEKEIIKALIKAQKVMKTLKCHNVGCDKTFKSGLGLKMHWELCGKSEEELNTNCEICGKGLKISSVSYHMRMSHSNKHTANEPTEDMDTVDEELDEPHSRSRKRLSAIKASKTIKKSTKGEIIISGSVTDNENDDNSDSETEVEEEVDAEPDPEERALIKELKKSKNTTDVTNNSTHHSSEHNLKQLLNIWAEFVISIKEFLREIPRDNNWHNEVVVNGRVVCPLEGCTQEFTTHYGLKYHYQRCGIEFKFMWKCKICGFEAIKGNKIIVHHIWNNHKELVPELPLDLLEFVSSLTLSNISANTNGQKQDVKRIETGNCALEFHQRFYKRKAFPKLVPTLQSWIPLTEDELSAYMSNPEPSPYFKCTLSADTSWKRLNLFESFSSEQHITFFVGGPVWSSAWCPVSHKTHSNDQYLAIASNMNWETTHTLNDTEIESGLIQIWNVGQLDKVFDKSIAPRLAFSIAHCCGIVWDMEWCPGGTAFDDILSYKKPKNSQTMARLGLLAIACGDGFVRIHSVPYPEALNKSYDNTVYYNEPIVILNPPGVGNSVNCENTICKCISWIKSNEQHLMVAGYGSGVIAVWDLTTTSSLLIVEQNASQTILRPLNSWMAHSAAVNGIKWCDTSSDQFLVSCSFDRSAKLWNLKDLTVPITTVKRGLLTAIDTHMRWNGMFLANDDCYLGFQNNVIFKDFGFLNYSAISLTTHKSCVWDMSISEWTSAVASVDAAGEAVVFPNFQLKADPKRKPFDRLPLFHISVQSLDETTDKSLKGVKNKKLKQKDNNKLVIDDKEPPLRSYAEFSSKYGLVFNDYDLANMKAIPIDEINRIRLPIHMQYQRLSDYPLLSINRVCWNPNHGSYVWLMTATQSGLCRLSCVSFLNPTLTANS